MRSLHSFAASALVLLGTGALGHEGENHNIPAVNPNPQKLVLGDNPLEMEPGRLQVYSLELPASGIYVTCEAVASQPFTVYKSRDKQPVLTAGQVIGASEQKQAEPFEAEDSTTLYRADISLYPDRP
jgi:hypothetical protein